MDKVILLFLVVIFMSKRLKKTLKFNVINKIIYMVNRTPFLSQEKYHTEVAGKLKLWFVGFVFVALWWRWLFFLSFDVVSWRVKMCINTLDYKGVHLQNRNRIIQKTESSGEIEIRTQIQKC